MESYLVPYKPPSENPKQLNVRNRWKRSLIEVSGRVEPKYRHDLSSLLMESYCEIGKFPHMYHTDGLPCRTYMSSVGVSNDAAAYVVGFPRKQGISAVDFDTKGVYLASVTRSGCLTVHDYEALYFLTNDTLPCPIDDEIKHVLHISLHQQLDSVRWNLANQDEVACASTKSNEVRIFDIGYISSDPVEVLRTRRAVSVIGSYYQKGVAGIAFSATDESRLLASDTHGILNIWDRRMSDLPCLELTTNSRCTLNSIQLHSDNQIVFAGGKNGNIYIWDLRGGKASSAFQNHNEVGRPPLTALVLASMLKKIGSLKAQSNIVPLEIYSIDFDPSCPYQLAFHLEDGWSGVLNIHNFQVTHVHCPPPAWLDDFNSPPDLMQSRKPAWLPTNSIYVVASSSDQGIHLLDFYPESSSPSHVDFIELI
ncbi:uncharacterized protein LOC123226138 isoform X2 [Mangifera indica]|uniref:uncharacterized protein LOC123205634 isoform X2 n=1 Tax=Mangifera indica TaxID=29780 RepID=UPI001CFB5B52|nr:uncharacterized protein LOC123205634 isoform X2 [Mangifera indica]XP_044506561.1 uncharacterized protein LOC123226138 isoform X2 [Mangifera indica]